LIRCFVTLISRESTTHERNELRLPLRALRPRPFVSLCQKRVLHSEDTLSEEQCFLQLQLRGRADGTIAAHGLQLSIINIFSRCNI